MTTRGTSRWSAKLLSSIVGVVAIASICHAAVDKVAITTCIDFKGFDTSPGVAPIFTSSGGDFPATATDGATYNSQQAAFTACLNDKNCLGFTNKGVTAMIGRLSLWSSDAGSCLYRKQGSIPIRPRYQLNLFSSWVPGTNTTAKPAANASEAERLCNIDKSCVAFMGAPSPVYIVGGQIAIVPSKSNGVVYVKQACPDVSGYFTKVGLAVLPVVGDAGADSGTAWSVAMAREFCRLNFACTSFSSDGSYVIGGVGDYIPYNGICTYVKHPCAPMRGFVAYNDVQYTSATAALARPSTNCFPNVYTECFQDPKCLAFDSMRYIFGTSAPPVTETTVKAAPGMCLYRKLSGGPTPPN